MHTPSWYNLFKQSPWIESCFIHNECGNLKAHYRLKWQLSICLSMQSKRSTVLYCKPMAHYWWDQTKEKVMLIFSQFLTFKKTWKLEIARRGFTKKSRANIFEETVIHVLKLDQLSILTNVCVKTMISIPVCILNMSNLTATCTNNLTVCVSMKIEYI